MASEAHIRIFLSSPGDVQAERDSARDLVKNVLPYAPFIRDRATFDIVSWDDPHASVGLSAHLTPQQAINKKLKKPSECDIVIAILWSRMGTPLPPEITRPDGTTYQSGTEWEFEDALEAALRNSKPEILLYRRTEKPLIEIDDPEFEAKKSQYQKTSDFFEKMNGASGSLSGTINSYATADEFRELLRQHLESIVSGLLGETYSEELGVTKAAVDNMLAILKEQKVPPEQLDAKLRDIAERHIDLVRQLHELSKSNDEPEITKRREHAATAIEKGDYDRAAELLEEAFAIDRRAIDDQQDALDRRKLSAAKTLGQQGMLERVRLNYRKAAKHFSDAASLILASDSNTRIGFLMEQAAALHAQGRQFGDNLAYVEATKIYRIILDEHPRSAPRIDRAKIQLSLGHTQLLLGTRAIETTWLVRAVASYEEAGAILSHDTEKLSWAAAQAGLGAALQNIGKREIGNAKLETALETIYRALEECDRDRAPVQWARTQNYLCDTLTDLGVREGNATRLRKAVDACRLALKEFTRERAPWGWAWTQNSLGRALQSLGQYEGKTEHLEKAVSAHRNSLTEWEQERVPLDWAWAQYSLGNALRGLGEQETGVKRAQDAREAYRQTLTEWTQERMPLQWAWTQENLGLAYKLMAERSQDQEILIQGISAIKTAIEVYDKGQVPYDFARANRNLAGAELLLADLREKGSNK